MRFRIESLCGLSLGVAVLCLTATQIQGVELVSMGAKAGLSVAKLRNDIIDDSGFQTGFCGGGFASLQVARGIEIQMEALYAERGGLYDLILTDDFGYGIGTGEQKYKISYIEIPLLARCRLPAQGNILPAVTAGPALAIKISSKLQTVLNPDDEYPAESEKDLEAIAATDIVFVFGLGFLVDLGQLDMTFDARYNLGLSNINTAATPDAATLKNSAYSLMIGFAF
jgi:hypothetical protein